MISPWQMSIDEITELLCKNGAELKCNKRSAVLDWISTLEIPGNTKVFVATGNTKTLAIRTLLDNTINELLSTMNHINSRKRIEKIDKRVDLHGVRP